MGYQQVRIPDGFSLFTVTFKEVGKDAFNINGISVKNTDGSAFTANNQVFLQKMDAGGNYLDPSLNYRSSKGGWCNKSTLQTDITLASGEAVCLSNITGEEKDLLVSGEVELTPISKTFGDGYFLSGNMTPVKINMNDISVYYRTAPDADWQIFASNNQVFLQKMDKGGNYLDPTYNYRSGKNGWCNKSTLVTDITFEPGESFCLNNISGFEIQLRFKKPIE